MQTYVATFTGRHAGAIGITSPFTVWLTGTSPDDVRARLYEHYEHITNLVVLTEAEARDTGVHP